MIKRIVNCLAAILMLTVMNSCSQESSTHVGKDGIAVREMTPDQFVCIQSDGPVDVYYTQKDEPHVKISAPQRLIDYVSVKVSKGILYVNFDARNTKLELEPNEEIDVYISGPTMLGLFCQGTGNIICKHDISAPDKIEITTTSAGDIKMFATIDCPKVLASSEATGDISIYRIKSNELKCMTKSTGTIRIKEINTRNLVASTSSAGDIHLLGGYAVNADFKADSSGDIYAADLICKSLTAQANSSGEIRCNASEKAVLETNSHGEIHLHGHPAVVDSTKAAHVDIRPS